MESIQNKEGNSAERAQEYYQSDSAFKYYTVIHDSVDYSGMGVFTEEITEKDTETGKEYIRGAGFPTIADANKNRDKKMFKYMLENMP
jgi:hypothetical protein